MLFRTVLDLVLFFLVGYVGYLKGRNSGRLEVYSQVLDVLDKKINEENNE